MNALKDWTLEEVINNCKNRTCNGCVFETRDENTFFCGFQEHSPIYWKIIPEMYAGKIEWHKYPYEEPPETYKKYIVALEWGLVDTLFYTGGKLGDYFDEPTRVSAWAELPEVPNWDGD